MFLLSSRGEEGCGKESSACLVVSCSLVATVVIPVLAVERVDPV